MSKNDPQKGRKGAPNHVPFYNPGKEGEIGSMEDSPEDKTVADLDFNLREQSEKDYGDISKDIVGASKEHLKEIRDSKKTLRTEFSSYFRKFLSWQFIVLGIMILLNSTNWLGFEITESLLNTFIVSVFVETLGAIGIMIAFAFSNKEERNIIEVMTTVIKNYQKFK